MSRNLTLLVVLTLLLGAAPCFAGELPSQDGLPPELTIAPKPALAEQLTSLQGLLTYLQSVRPAPGGGILSGLKGLLGGGGATAKAYPVPPELLALNAEPLRGKLVSLTGVYRRTGTDAGVLPYDGGQLRISMPPGIKTEGFGQQGPDGLPVTVEGIVEITSGVTSVRATAVRPEQWLVLLRVGRIQELLGQPEQALATYETAYGRAQAARSPFAAYAKTAAARLAYEKRDRKKARGLYAMAWNPFTGVDKSGRPLHYTWLPETDGSGWRKVPVVEAISGPPRHA